MNLPDTVMIAGLCVAVTACAFLLVARLRSARQSAEPDIHLASTRRSARLDQYMGMVWSGFLLVQGAQIFNHLRPDGTAQLSLLSMGAAAGVVFVCGGFAGRLLLRREMRQQAKEGAQTARA